MAPWDFLRDGWIAKEIIHCALESQVSPDDRNDKIYK
jgi:hypothetical protein